ncbi:MAG: HAD-IIB family hydrolase [Provencibacterium sp.]|jgi:Cof subfamily protein (haloacid dehalogenase superfamily)|nr:HAD-IIB family hydrolase [Provencibacterium sp.]
MENTTLYVSDLDGTLLNSRDILSARTLALLNDLISRGMRFTYATARSLVSARRVTAGLCTRLPVIVYNGAFIMEADSGRILDSSPFTEEECRHARTALEGFRLHPLVYAFAGGCERVSWQTAFENEGVRHYLRQREGDPRLHPLSSPDELYAGQPFYYTCIGQREDLLPAFEAFRADGRYRCTLQQELYRPEYWLEIMPAQATKARAARKLQKRRGCERLVCFGDAFNDLPLFRQSDAAYAVENAVPALKEAATGIIGGNDADGVALWLSEHFHASV